MEASVQKQSGGGEGHIAGVLVGAHLPEMGCVSDTIFLKAFAAQPEGVRVGISVQRRRRRGEFFVAEHLIDQLRTADSAAPTLCRLYFFGTSRSLSWGRAITVVVDPGHGFGCNHGVPSASSVADGGQNMD
jgi:hypothetical protein